MSKKSYSRVTNSTTSVAGVNSVGMRTVCNSDGRLVPSSAPGFCSLSYLGNGI